MNTDMELLKFAAKAAGINYRCISPVHAPGFDPQRTLILVDKGVITGFWIPLDDDGDALRLAATLKLDVIFYKEDVEAYRENGQFSTYFAYATVKYSSYPDTVSATRRAIVRAAAEIGKGISQPVRNDLPEDNYYKTQAEAFGRAAP